MAESQNERVMKDLRKYIGRIGKKFVLDKVILFGSRARGDYFLDSDIDLILISEDFGVMNFRERMIEVLKEWNGGIDLEVLCYTPKEFERKKKQIGIVKQALKEGVLFT